MNTLPPSSVLAAPVASVTPLAPSAPGTLSAITSSELPEAKPLHSRPITEFDKAVNEVRQHLHDAFNDKTVEGQELKLGRAYRVVTQFEMDNAGKLTRSQAASIATTRDQVAKYQIDLHESKPEPLQQEVKRI